MRIYQVTLGSGATSMIPTGASSGPSCVPMFQWMTVQNNAIHSVRIGDATVSATKGILLAAGSSMSIPLTMEYSSSLSDWFIFGTAADVVDVMIIE